MILGLCTWLPSTHPTPRFQLYDASMYDVSDGGGVTGYLHGSCGLSAGAPEEHEGQSQEARRASNYYYQKTILENQRLILWVASSEVVAGLASLSPKTSSSGTF